jgi:hypothetical protein
VKCKDPRPPELDKWLEECGDIQCRQAVKKYFLAVRASLQVAVSGRVPFSRRKSDRPRMAWIY